MVFPIHNAAVGAPGLPVVIGSHGDAPGVPSLTPGGLCLRSHGSYRCEGADPRVTGHAVAPSTPAAGSCSAAGSTSASGAHRTQRCPSETRPGLCSRVGPPLTGFISVVDINI